MSDDANLDPKSCMAWLSSLGESDDCQIFPGHIARNGYGNVWTSEVSGGAHRVSYEMHVAPIPDGLDLDHLCRNRACVNPRHLEPVTRRVNLLRGDTIPARNAAKVACPSGHPYAGSNLYVDAKGRRYCRECRRVRNRSANRRDRKVSR